MILVVSKPVCIGDRLCFDYNGKRRSGYVHKYNSALKVLTLELGDENTVYHYPYPKRQYRSFHVHKMQNIVFPIK